jgi:uncharacterized protein YfeS
MNDDHDPWNEPSHRHPRALALMAPSLWDCVDEEAPFGSDEGAEAYVEYRSWRSDNPNAPLVDCIAWIGDEADYPDTFTFDATIIATVLGQLVAEGRVDREAKPFAFAAIERQSVEASAERCAYLRETRAAIDAA